MMSNRLLIGTGCSILLLACSQAWFLRQLHQNEIIQIAIEKIANEPKKMNMSTTTTTTNPMLTLLASSSSPLPLFPLLLPSSPSLPPWLPPKEKKERENGVHWD